MVWQENLMSNLLVLGILAGLGVVIYCKVKNLTLPEFFKEMKEIISPSEEVV